ncbi:MAG: ABC transporter ATP-binding protein [Lactobacillales bacterium]|jgi:ABC-type multidrug transport system ATPase subunit|nr:ABC transporter ATP-binding protein [Lactobacillales bacterium]
MSLHLNNLTIGYLNQQLFSIDSLCLENGIYLLSGKNGSGKSTFCDVLAGIKQPLAGDYQESLFPILYLGSTGVGMSDWSLLENIKILYWMFQTTLTPEINEVIQQTLFWENQLEQEYGSSSLGMQLKVGISLLFSNLSWELILFDETLSGLDQESTEMIINQLKNQHCPVVLVSHHGEELERKLKNKLKISGGMLQYGTTEKIQFY